MSITLTDVRVRYERTTTLPVVSGQFARASATAVMGPNGAGKSSLLKAILGLAPLASGSVDLGPWARSDLGYLPQQSALDRHFPVSVGEVVAMGDWHRSGWAGGQGADARARIARALDHVGLAGYAHRTLDVLSAGQFQRVLFARLCLQDAPVVLLDEPFTGVDSETTERLMALIAGWREEGRIIVAVLHDRRQVSGRFDQVLWMDGAEATWGAANDLTTPTRSLA